MFNTEELIEFGGLLLVFLVVYGQTGLFFCFFIPSGAFMFAAGAMVASNAMDWDLPTACFLLTIAAILGNITGYLFGRKAGPLLYKRQNSRFFNKAHLQAAERFYEKNGGKALAFGLFLPIARTFAPIVAGMVRMPFGRFMFYVIIGSTAWVISFVMAGYLIGRRPLLRPYLKYIIIGIIIVVSIPVVIRVLKGIKGYLK